MKTYIGKTVAHDVVSLGTFITPCKKVFRLSVEIYVLAVDGMLRDGVKEVCRLSSDDSVG